MVMSESMKAEGRGSSSLKVKASQSQVSDNIWGKKIVIENCFFIK